uniref:Uncharacterized protein n=1 Tax=uncultured Planctomycetota bacterium TaxID=120965 RepID=A0A5B8KIJ7_9BACT|nr:hypothetical protein fos2004AM_00027 [uncultured Planctomycetota bacterium]
MYRFRAQWGALVGVVLMVWYGGGCLDGSLPADLADALGLGEAETAVKDAAVFSLLQDTVDVDSADLATQTVDEAANFAESETLYAEVSLDAVELPEESILEDVLTSSGGPPIVHGRLGGRFWSDVPGSSSDQSGGIFRGRWIAADGQPLGVVRGQYRPLRPGDLPAGLIGGGVFHGKYVDREGHFRGLLRGRYGHGPEGRGLFFGRWFDRHDRLVGILKGDWRDEPGTEGGSFAGRWAAFNLCEEVATLPEYEFEEGDFGGFDTSDEVLAAEEILAEEQPDPLQIRIENEPDLLLADEPPCIDPDLPYGFLRGWHRPSIAEDESEPPVDGVFRGRWRTANGVVVGVLFGRYEPLPPEEDPSAVLGGENPPTEGRVMGKFYGKYVNSSGQFRGFVRGVYGASVHDVGVFHGHYFNPNTEAQGTLLGRWDHAPQRPGGPFFGFWYGVDLEGES